MTDDEIIDAILKAEGAEFVNDVSDAGGPTKFGVTQKTLSAWMSMWLGRTATIDEVKNLTETQARQIYQALYIQSPGFFQIEDGRLKALAVDCGVAHGPRRVIEWLQEMVGVKVDGILGPKTAAAINSNLLLKDLYFKLLARRIRFYGEIISERRGQAKFAKGWMDRAAGFLEG